MMESRKEMEQDLKELCENYDPDQWWLIENFMKQWFDEYWDEARKEAYDEGVDEGYGMGWHDRSGE